MTKYIYIYINIEYGITKLRNYRIYKNYYNYGRFKKYTMNIIYYNYNILSNTLC